MATLLTILHIVVCLFLIIVVLLQSGKAADLAGAFGGMGSQTAFGPRGAATVLTKATTISAVLFMLTSISLGVLDGGAGAAGESVVERTGTATSEPSGAPLGGTTIPLQAPAAAPEVSVETEGDGAADQEPAPPQP